MKGGSRPEKENKSMNSGKRKVQLKIDESSINLEEENFSKKDKSEHDEF